MKKFWALLLSGSLAAPSVGASNLVDPGLTGWGNLVVPGLGASFRGDPLRGVAEAALEIGLFYGGTFGVREGTFTIDTTIVTPQKGSLVRPLVGQTMQQLGLKLHMYNTFYHYQQASLALEATETEHWNAQPLYRGNALDVLTAPFKWKHLSNPWVFGLLLASAGFIIADYATGTVTKSTHIASGFEDGLFLTQNGMIQPLGSAFGEEPLFRGFMQREFHRYTGSFWVANLMQAGIFTLLHPEEAHIPAFLGGAYFGFLVHHFDGDIEQAVAAHFWINTLNGIVAYLRFRRAQGKNVPFNPPIGIVLGMPL